MDDNIQYSYSKLGGKYRLDEIEALDKQYHQELRAFKLKRNNNTCFECGTIPTNWISVNLGIFLCVNCAQVHRGLGTHISKIKSCMGTYRWHPDEMKYLKKRGNTKAEKLYGCVKQENPSSEYLTQKYQNFSQN